MQVALIQTNLVWENPEANRTILAQKINAINEPIDLIVLPEMFTSGFSMHPESIAETMNGETISLLKSLAKTQNCAITGSLVIVENNLYYNRMVFVFPNGQLEQYDKKHLFTLAGEDQKYQSGSKKVIVNYRDFKICLQVCYDLRFPTFARNLEDYDLLIYVANWPETRINAWNILLKARAVENMCFTIGVNRLGIDGNNLNYSGQSQIIDCLGNELIAPHNNEGVLITTLSKPEMLATRTKLAFLNDRD